jgi:hypothetical protein
VLLPRLDHAERALLGGRPDLRQRNVLFARALHSLMF